MAQFDGGHAAKRQRMDNGNSMDFYNSDTFGNNQRKQRFEQKPNHILLLTVANPAYPITTDIIHTICSPSGNVLRIVIFKKNGIQAMVEFDSVETAERAKESLNGCDIYSGCCTLKIEFAKPSRLNVYKNDDDSWDYTNEFNKQNEGKPGGGRPALLRQPPSGYGPPPPGNLPPYGNRGPPGRFDDYDGNYMHGQPGRGPYGGPPGDQFMGDRPPFHGDGGYQGPPGNPGRPAFGGAPQFPTPNQPSCSAVLMVYGLNQSKMNCDKLFNILCVYGNIVRIKFLKSKEGCAMVEMDGPLASQKVYQNLNGVTFFGSKLQLGFSKQTFINEVHQPFPMPDSTDSFMNYANNRNNRFSTPEAANKNRILKPTKTLHFFNAPVGITEDQLLEKFDEKDVPHPAAVKIFPSKNEGQKSSSGLFEFNTVDEAMEALACVNHCSIPNPAGKYPYCFKLCFSSTDTRPKGGRGGGRDQQY